MTVSTDSQRRLIWHGMYLFLLGLLIGFAEGASGAYPSRVKLTVARPLQHQETIGRRRGQPRS